VVEGVAAAVAAAACPASSCSSRRKKLADARYALPASTVAGAGDSGALPPRSTLAERCRCCFSAASLPARAGDGRRPEVRGFCWAGWAVLREFLPGA